MRKVRKVRLNPAPKPVFQAFLPDAEGDNVNRMLLRRSLLSLLHLALAFSIVGSWLPFAAHCHVLAGATVDEEFAGDCRAYVVPDQFPAVQPKLVPVLQEGVTFVGTGAVKVVSSKLEIPDPNFTRSDRGGYYGTPGVARVQWTVPPETPAGSRGWIEVKVAPMEREHGFLGSFDSKHTQVRNGKRVFREIVVHRGYLSLIGGRLLYGAIGLPVALLLHTIWWMRQLRKERPALLAPLLPPDPPKLPCTFHPNPLAEWDGYNLVLVIFSGLGVFMLGLVLWMGFISGIFVGVVLVTLSVGLFFALLMVWWMRRVVVTLKVDADSVAYARGRGPLQWITARWAEMVSVRQRTMTHKGVTHEWIEMVFPGHVKRPIYTKTILHYALVRDTVLALSAHHRP